MSKRNVFRVSVFGNPSAEKWLLADALPATRKRDCGYELVTDRRERGIDILVVDAENDEAVARWMAMDPMGQYPAAFFGRVPPRAKCAVIVQHPITSGRIVEALDQISRRFLGETSATTLGADVFDRQLAAMAA
jgi:hypothetical protein